MSVQPSNVEFDETLDIALPIGKLICDGRRHRRLFPGPGANVTCCKGRMKSFSQEHVFLRCKELWEKASSGIMVKTKEQNIEGSISPLILNLGEL